jgi:MFS family permease
MSDYRNLTAVVLALTLMQVAGGVLAIVVPLGLEARGVGPFAIGAVTAFYGVGLMAGSIFAPRLIASVGHIRAFAFFAAFAAALTLALYARIDAISWAIVRMGLGACVAGIFTAGESWIATEAPKQSRGRLLGFYHVVTKIALILGAFLVAGVAADSPGPFMLAGGLFALCLAPVAATRRTGPPPPSRDPFALGALVKMAPAAFVAAAAAGLVNGAVNGLSPVYAAPMNPDDPTLAAAVFYAAFMIGGVVSQFPAGMISDTVDRRLVIGVLGGISAAAAIGLTIVPPHGAPWLVLPLAFVWGAGAYSHYGIAVAHAVDRVPPHLHARAMAGMLLVWAAGNVVGPLIAGAAMQTPLGPRGLFVYAALGLIAMTAAMVRRSYARDPVPPEAREPFATVQASSMVAAELDPRVADAPAAEDEPTAPDIGSDPGAASIDEPIAPDRTPDDPV